MAARPTVGPAAYSGLGVGLDSAAEGWRRLKGAWAGGKQVGSVEEDVEGEEGDKPRYGSGAKDGKKPKSEEEHEVWDYGVDDTRGWVIAAVWLIAAGVEWVPAELVPRCTQHRNLVDPRPRPRPRPSVARSLASRPFASFHPDCSPQA